MPVDNFKNSNAHLKYAQYFIQRALYLSLNSDGQSVSIRALGGGHFLHVPVWLQHQFLGHGLIVGIPQTQAAIAAFSTGFHRTISRHREGAVLACLNLEGAQSRH